MKLNELFARPDRHSRRGARAILAFVVASLGYCALTYFAPAVVLALIVAVALGFVAWLAWMAFGPLDRQD